MDLSGERVLVTGAGGGIGSELAGRLDAAGAQTALTSQHAGKLQAVTAGLDGERCWSQAADLANEQEVVALLAGVAERFGTLTALVNVAGASIPGQIQETMMDDYRRVWDANVTSTFLASKHALAHFGEPGGTIVNVSSVAGLRPNGTAPLYCTAKAAVEMLTRALALQVKERGIRLSAITPGGTDTPFWGDRPVDRSALMSTADVVEAILFALSAPPTVQITTVVLEPFGR